MDRRSNQSVPLKELVQTDGPCRPSEVRRLGDKISEYADKYCSFSPQTHHHPHHGQHDISVQHRCFTAVQPWFI
ncbi:hypothetical protein CSKR_109508 [Clonorchis sinensis]|uniref:Uncharacterized protein n=1 Tax=Clonorchis sinensis TaxID=79923 RepID=A0A3R7GEA0_CLOSI|nr:hypothetical protein CSKR_109508 [Clonorchis sinensis]